MRLKTDENMPGRVVTLLRERGHDVDTVLDEQLLGKPDAVIADAARRAGRMLFTLDRGYPSRAGHDHPGIVVLRLMNQSVPIIEAAVRTLLDHQDLAMLARCIVVVEPGRIRVRRPPQ